MNKRYKHLYIDTHRPVVFLDIDGVLNGAWQHENRSSIYYDETVEFGHDQVLVSKRDAVSRVLRRHNAQVVIVSSWMQYNRPADDLAIRQLGAFLGLDVVGSVRTGGGPERGEDAMDLVMTLNITHWMVIDDSGHLYRDAGVPETRLISPHGRYGISDAELERLDRCLVLYT